MKTFYLSSYEIQKLSRENSWEFINIDRLRSITKEEYNKYSYKGMLPISLYIEKGIINNSWGVILCLDRFAPYRLNYLLKALPNLADCNIRQDLLQAWDAILNKDISYFTADMCYYLYISYLSEQRYVSTIEEKLITKLFLYITKSTDDCGNFKLAYEYCYYILQLFYKDFQMSLILKNAMLELCNEEELKPL